MAFCEEIPESASPCSSRFPLPSSPHELPPASWLDRLLLRDAMQRPPRLDPLLIAPPPTPRRALLINPFYPKQPLASFGKHVLTPALSLTTVAASTPPEWEVCFWDENLLQGPPPSDPFPAVVGITVHLTFARRAYELAAWYRLRGAKVVLGGLHILSCPDEAAPHADALVVGEGMQVWPDILRDVELHCLQPLYVGTYQRPYRDDPPPRRKVLPASGYLTPTSIVATRGCHNRCGYCYLSTEGLRMPYQVRDVEQVVQEFRDSPEPYCVFIDNNLCSRKEYLRSLCRALRPVEKIWSAAVTIDVADDPALVREMALSGCTGVFIGFETLDGDNLDAARKKSPRPEEYARRVAILHDYGIQVNGSFVLGFDQDGPDVFARTVDWIERNRLECATFHILTPYPGTPLFRQLKGEGRLFHRNWDLYDTSHAVFQPKRMTAEELEAGYAWCYRTMQSNGSIWRRRPADWSQIPGYLGSSYLYKKTNWLWPFLIRWRQTHTVWRPLVEMARRRNLAYRKRLEKGMAGGRDAVPVYAGV